VKRSACSCRGGDPFRSVGPRGQGPDPLESIAASGVRQKGTRITRRRPRSTPTERTTRATTTLENTATVASRSPPTATTGGKNGAVPSRSRPTRSRPTSSRSAANWTAMSRRARFGSSPPPPARRASASASISRTSNRQNAPQCAALAARSSSGSSTGFKLPQVSRAEPSFR
jgi:hypothetical protein